MTKPPSPTYLFKQPRSCPINDGYIQAFGHPNLDLYIANGITKKIRTDVSLFVPAGVTVQIRGLPPHRREGLSVVDEDLVGPVQVDDLVVYVRNGGDTTFKLKPGDPIAAIRAIETPVTLRFRVEQPAEPEPAAPRRRRAVKVAPEPEQAEDAPVPPAPEQAPEVDDDEPISRLLT